MLKTLVSILTPNRTYIIKLTRNTAYPSALFILKLPAPRTIWLNKYVMT